jgi:hypothetical protein
MRKIKQFFKSQSKSDLISMGITIVVCALIGGGLAFAYVKMHAKPKAEAPLVKTTYKIADWETYTNESEGVTFKYPKSWVMDDTSGDVQILEPYSVVDPENPPLYGEIRVGVHKGDDDKHKFADWDYDRYFNYITSGGKSEGEEFAAGNIDTEHKQKVKVDGQEAVMVSYKIDKNGLYGAFIKHGNAIYNISLTSGEDHQKEMIKRYRPLLRKVISTFKFTK